MMNMKFIYHSKPCTRAARIGSCNSREANFFLFYIFLVLCVWVSVCVCCVSPIKKYRFISNFQYRFAQIDTSRAIGTHQLHCTHIFLLFFIFARWCCLLECMQICTGPFSQQLLENYLHILFYFFLLFFFSLSSSSALFLDYHYD